MTDVQAHQAIRKEHLIYLVEWVAKQTKQLVDLSYALESDNVSQVDVIVAINGLHDTDKELRIELELLS